VQKADFCKTFCTRGPRVAVTLPPGGQQGLSAAEG
jgi:hypothetical protein